MPNEHGPTQNKHMRAASELLRQRQALASLNPGVQKLGRRLPQLARHILQGLPHPDAVALSHEPPDPTPQLSLTMLGEET